MPPSGRQSPRSSRSAASAATTNTNPASSRSKRRTWQDLAAAARAYLARSLAPLGLPETLPQVIGPSAPGQDDGLPSNVLALPKEVLTARAYAITETGLDELLEKLKKGADGGGLSSEEVTSAFLMRAGCAGRVTNCLTELLHTRALNRARFLDEYLHTHGKPIGPLHGLPLSVKEHFGMAGLGTNSGFCAWFDDPAKIPAQDAHVLRILERAGAVFHGRTTLPQTTMHLETDSNLYGVTVSPWNRALSAGGSSGGEGALIGMRGSLLGVGSDVGGSIRSPAANNGLYGLKPTGFRIPSEGWSSIPPGADSVVTVVGPLSSSLSGVQLFMKTIIDAKPWLIEPDLIPLPWDTAIRINPSSSEPLKIGVMWHDQVVMPHPPITRVLREVVSRLKHLPNVEVIEFTPYLHDEAWAILSSLYWTDGGAEDAAAMAASGEPWRPLTKWIIKENECVKKLSLGELQYWQEERESYRSEYAKAWNDTATEKNTDTGEMRGVMDVLLCPVGPGVAPRHDTARYWGYTSQWNLLDYPAAVFPAGKVEMSVDKAEPDYEPMTDIDGENWSLWNQAPQDFDGCPVSLQLVGRRFEDEKVLSVLEFMQQAGVCETKQ